MVKFNELRISDDKSCIQIDCEVEDLIGYEGFYIDEIYIEYYTKVSSLGVPSESHAYQVYKKGDEDPEATRIIKATTMVDIDNAIGTEAFGTDTFNKGLFLITVKCDGTPVNLAVYNSYTCGEQGSVDVGIALDWKVVYEYGMAYAARFAYSCDNSCEIPNGFENFILLWNALKLAVNTCDWTQIKKLWPMFLRASANVQGGAITLSSGCGCGH